MVRGIPIKHPEKFCEGCALGKMHRKPFPRASSYRAESMLELAHGDLCGPISPATAGGGKYFLLVVDNYSRYMWLEILKSKDEAFRFLRKSRPWQKAKQLSVSGFFALIEEVSLTPRNSLSSVRSMVSEGTPPLHILLSKMELWRGEINL
jgi:hypothetical protein